MDPFLLFVVGLFGFFGWAIYKLIRYSAQTVGDDSPLVRTVSYQYEKNDFLKWAETPLVLPVCLILGWVCWVMLPALSTATRFWHYLLAVSFVLLTVAFVAILIKFIGWEKRLWGIVRGTHLVLDPQPKTITVQRGDTITELTAANTACIRLHWLNQGKLGYRFYEFMDPDGQSTFFYDYGKGLAFGIEAYFKDVPFEMIEHRYPFGKVPLI